MVGLMHGSGCRVLVAALVAEAASLFGSTACGNGDGGGAVASPPPKTERDAYTKWNARQAANRYEQTGRQATIDYYNNEAGSDGQWYLSIMDANSGVLVAHATIPSWVGTNSGQRVDITGHAYGPLLRASPESGHWMDYVFYNPQTDTDGTKHTWAKRQDDLVFASGWYEDSYPVSRPTKAEPSYYTRGFVEDIAWHYQGHGRDALIDHICDSDNTDPLSMYGQWHGFVVDLQGVVIARPTIPESVGRTLGEILGATPEGLASADEMVAATETGKWVDYTYINPQSGDWETNHTWIVKRDDVLIASGWYESD